MKECPFCHLCLDDQYPVCPHDGAPLESVFDGPPILDGKYRLISRLGSGGMGQVYKARHQGLERLFSVKILRTHRRDDEDALRRFALEAEALGRLGHPNVVDVTDFGTDRDISYLVMEYLDGVSLAERLGTGPLPIVEALEISSQVAAALDHAHAAGILHRDLKPANVFLVDGPKTTVKLLDFGLARFFADPDETPEAVLPELVVPGIVLPGQAERVSSRARAGETPSSQAMGTPGYIAPEILAGQSPTPASDLWAFGALIYSTLLGRPPAPATRRLRPTEAAPNKEIELVVDELISSCLATDPASRPHNGEALVSRLRRTALRAEQKLWWRREAPRRLALAMLLGLLAIPGIGLLRSPLGGLEDRLIDLRFFLTPPRPVDVPVLLVEIDDATLEDDATALVDRADEVGRLLSRVLESGAAGVGLDLLLPESWGRSPAFAGLVVQHSERLALAAFSPPDGPVVGANALDGLVTAALGPSKAREVFGFVNIDRDGDGVVRRARTAYNVENGPARPSLAARLAQLDHAQPSVSRDIRLPRDSSRAFRIDFTVDHRLLERLSWRDLATTLEETPQRFQNRFVLVGATFTGAGDGPYRVPHPRSFPSEISGLTLQSLKLATILGEGRLSEAPRGPATAAAALWTALAVASLLLLRPTALALAPTLLGIAGWLTMAHVVFARDGMLLDVAPFIFLLLLMVGIAFALRQWMGSLPMSRS